MKYPSYLMKSRWPTTPNAASTPARRLPIPAVDHGNVHNFQNSTFWVSATGFFKIPVVQLTYHLSERVARKIGMKSPNVYFRANNLLTLAPEKERLLLNIGAEPACTWFALGFKANF